jgi:hypothetical protein
MPRRRPARRNLTPAAEGMKALRGDIPHSMKVALRLAQRGGRQQKRVCRACGQRGKRLQVWAPESAWRVEPTEGSEPQTYWLCDRHYQEECLRQGKDVPA